ncbi:DUF3949 domain-containing protein [Viridibacillus sp. NPDC093762]|uniref:DUF3949 domain-containing protein n=1 Tax=Viridibacillus sp. NPDC093762 TaxID=3390720 RepID=UPI003D08C013
MGLNITLWIVAAYILLSLILMPMQYKYITHLKETDQKIKELGLTKEEYYEKMSFETQELHFNAQGNLLFLGANLFSTLLYNWEQRKNRTFE